MANRSALAVAAISCGLLAAPQAVADDRILPVPTITIYPGDVIRAEAVIDRRFRLAHGAQLAVIESRNAIVGKVARRTLLPGQPIPFNAVNDPQVVRRGVPAQVIFKENGLVITGIVEPLQSASVNESVKARNPDSGLTVVGIVQGDGTIRVGGE